MSTSKRPNKKEEEYVTNKVLIVFSLCLSGVLILMGIKNLVNYGSTYSMGIMLIKVLLAISFIGVVCGIFMIVREKKKNINTNMRILTGRNVFIVFLVSFIMFVLVNRYVFLVFKLFYIILPVLAVYYLIYHSYQAEFTVIAFDGGFAISMLFVAKRAMESTNFKNMVYPAVLCMVILLVFQLIIVLKIKNSDGKIRIFKKDYELAFSKNAYKMMIITPFIMTLAVAFGAFTAPVISLYTVFAVAAYLFITGVYYTVKLM